MRTDEDSWDIKTGVGSTALFVAAARALGGRADDAPAHDPLAELFVTAAGGEWADLLAGRLDEHPLLTAEFGIPFQQHQLFRTRYFDDYLHAAVTAGIRQVVVLAAGLDSRAYRLPWLADCTVYELDRPQVLDYKRETLAGRAPIADRREVAVDLRADWPKSLRDSGFDADRPTAWLIEGLLIYLTPAAQDQLFDTVRTLSAPGSRVAVEQMDPLPAEAADALVADGNAGSEWVQLIYNEPHSDATAWFGEHGWTGERIDLPDYIRSLGQNPAGPDGRQQSLINLATVIRP
ncbi:putative S-adenosyl-L-methionine-dependent methyltransferase [Nocardia nova SH22a]|uniref:S-adenosyl-L-methionine-dependent methyltransferase n=1 Tax=Nocardia nova SH22a TaxID=1415166 RepID=W5TKI2_9NOCA|nr:SAM-dependent methyltransferase [Nocardia nova]AHH19453.1 putative S-adenosyl-L-methionine-dependent methyltransferase [Nocardia nova SH22a]